MKVDYKNGGDELKAKREPKALTEPVQVESLHKRRGWVLIAVGIFIIAAIILGVKPAYHAANRWRARRLAASALDLALRHEMDKALLKAHSAYQLKPDEPDVVRAIAKVLNLRRDPTAFLFWQLLAKAPGATAEDGRSYVESALDHRQIAAATDELRILLNAEPNSAPNYLLLSKLKALTGDLAGGLACAQKAHELNGSNEETSLFLASLQLASPDLHAAGIQLLRTLVNGSSQTNLSAIALAARQKDLPAEDQDQLIERLRKHPLAQESDRLLMLELEIQRHPDQRDALLKTAAENHRAGGWDSLRQFGIWLNAHGESARTIEVITLDQALTRKDLFLVYLDALSAQKKWGEVGAVLDRSGLPLDETYVEIYKSRSYTEMGDADGAGKHWRFAQIAAQKAAGIGNPEQAFYIANYAEKLGQLSNAESMYRYLAGSPITARSAYEALLRIAVTKGTRQTCDVLREMRERWPEDVAVQNDCAYFRLLLGEDIDASRKKAAELTAKYPESLPHQTTLALAYLRSGNTADALKVFEHLTVAWDKAPEPSIAVYAAVLNANGRKEDARRLAAALHTNTLRPEEKALIEF